MNMLSNLWRSLQNAISGWRYLFSSQQNFRVQVFCGLLVFIAAWLLKVRRQDWLVILLLVTMVLVLETLNTVFEFFLDMVKPKINSYVKMFKDMLAAMVLLASIAAGIIGLVIFYPYLRNIFVH
jgi:diacylglycerol kinase